MKMLIEAGADINLPVILTETNREYEGQAPLNFVLEYNNDDELQLLMQSGQLN